MNVCATERERERGERTATAERRGVERVCEGNSETEAAHYSSSGWLTRRLKNVIFKALFSDVFCF